MIRFDYIYWTACENEGGPSRLQLINCSFFSRASGKILKAYAQDFEALSKDGHMFVIVQNTGYVTADFAVSFNFLLSLSFSICLWL